MGAVGDFCDCEVSMSGDATLLGSQGGYDLLVALFSLVFCIALPPLTGTKPLHPSTLSLLTESTDTSLKSWRSSW